MGQVSKLDKLREKCPSYTTHRPNNVVSWVNSNSWRIMEGYAKIVRRIDICLEEPTRVVVLDNRLLNHFEIPSALVFYFRGSFLSEQQGASH